MKKIVLLSTACLVLLGGCANPRGQAGKAVYPVSVDYYLNEAHTEVYYHEDATPGEPLSEPEKPSIDDKTFLGWVSDKSYTSTVWDYYNDVCPLDITEMKMTAKWQDNIKDIYVYFYLSSSDDDNVEPYKTLVAHPGDKIVPPSNPTKEGKTFIGWSELESESSLIDFDSYTIPSDYSGSLFIYGVWRDETMNTVTVNWYVDESDDETYLTNEATESRHLIPPENDPTKEGYIFEGWRERGKTGLVDIDTFVVPDGLSSIDMVAKFHEVAISEVLVSYYKISTDLEPMHTETLHAGDSLTPPATPTREGFTFNGWSTSDNISGKISLEEYRVPENITSLRLNGLWDEVITSETYRIYFQAKNFWKNGATFHTSAYVWNENSETNADFPGVRMHYVGYDEVEDCNYYSIDLETSKAWTHIIFSRNNADETVLESTDPNFLQTIDIDLLARGSSNCVWIDDEKDTDGKINKYGWFNFDETPYLEA